MNVFKQNSVLRYLPINLNKRQFLIFDAIRFSLEIIDNSWSSLINQIENLSIKESEKDLPKLFGETWNIIDNVQRFINFHSKLKIERQSDYLNSLKHVKKFRHTLQHLDERIDEALIDSDVPVYGVLSWNYFNPETKSTEVLIASSGIARYNHKFNFEVPAFNASNLVDNVILELIITENRKEFSREKLNLSLLICDLIVAVERIENDLDEQFIANKVQRADWKKRKDIIIKLTNK